MYYIKYENITINGRQNCDYKKSKRMYNRWLVLIRNSVRSLNMGQYFFKDLFVSQKKNKNKHLNF